MRDKKGQATIFWIVGIALVIGIAVYFIAFSGLKGESVPTQFQEVYNYYSSCVTQDLKDAIDLAEVQGGRLEAGAYIPGSDYAPFSSHLNFMGFPVPYWYYISGNGLIKTNLPSKNNLESEIADYISKGIGNCNFAQFYEQGFDIQLGKPQTRVKISGSSVSASVNADLTISRNEQSVKIRSKDFQVQSSLGNLFDDALNFYNREMKEGFIENYSNDVLRNYAPVDGVLVQCGPKVWRTSDVLNDLQNGLESNLATIKFGSKSSAKDDAKYFTVDYSTSNEIRIMYSKNWPQKVEINGDGVSQNSMVAQPVGSQQGLGIMGFCYVPYHYIYDLSFPVLIQVSNGNEIFQFPISIIIDKNMPRKGMPASEFQEPADFDVCAYENQNIKVTIKDNKYNPVDGRISYGCLGQECSLGESQGGVFEGKAPICVNGYLRVQADGYQDGEVMMSTNEDLNEKEVFLNKMYNVSVNVTVGGKPIQGQALVSFEGNISASAVIPDSQDIQLAEGVYKITVYAYGNSSIKIPASTSQQCVQVSKPGLSGLFGGKEDRCFTINNPETTLENVLIGGGEKSDYFFEDQLSRGKLTLDAQSLPYPKSIEQLQKNYEMFEVNTVEVIF